MDFVVTESHGYFNGFGLQLCIWDQLIASLTAILLLLDDFVEYVVVCCALGFIIRSGKSRDYR